jgi:L-alanine-DL-glutamate epimerase-like enolase superfamily enzyme
MSIGVPRPTEADPRALSIVQTFPITALMLEDEVGHRGLGYVTASPDVAGLVTKILSEARPSLSEMLVSGTSVGLGRGTSGAAHTEPVPGAGADRQAAHAAIALAAWDLLGTQLGVPCADLWGRESHQGIGAYYSGFFTSRTSAELVHEAEEARASKFTAIKMRASHTLTEDLERVSLLATVYPEPGTIAMDAIWGWTLERAVEFAKQSPVELLWLEDPFHYDDDGLRRYARFGDMTRPGLTTAGEACRELDELIDLRDRGSVQNLLLDVACLAGPVPFLRAADRLAKVGARIGAHLYAGASLQLLAALNNTLPVEAVGWQDPPFVTTPTPDHLGMTYAKAPGLGQQFDHERFARTGEQVSLLQLADATRGQ